jgi:phenylalanyl-tRNA synthetase beta chain
MPVVAIGVHRLNELLGGPERPMETLVEALENLGCDVEDTAEAVHYRCPVCELITERLAHEAAPRRCDQCETEQPVPLPEVGREAVIRLDLLADRPDLFDAGGISRALKGMLGVEQGLPRYEVQPGSIAVSVDARLGRPQSYWPHIVAAELEVPPIDEQALRELMRLQEALHWGIGRDRKLCAIGVYDLATIQPPIRFTLIEPDGLRFVPLAHASGEVLSAGRILTEHPKGRAYAHLLSAFEAYPLLIDAKDQVLSMPPIINSEETRVRLGTTRLFAEVTGVVFEAARAALHTLVSSLAELGASVRSVRVVQPDGEAQDWPQLAPRSHEIDLDDARRWLGLHESDPRLIELFRKMRLDVRGAGPRVQVQYPAFRTDIRHAVDLYADLAIGHGYAAMPMRLIPTMTVSRERPEERLSNRARSILVGLGYWEVMSLVQTTPAKHFEALRLTSAEDHVRIANPKNADVDVVRCHLMTGVLETLSKNRRRAVPQRFFEVGNVVLLDAASETGTREERRLCLAAFGPEVGYAAVRAAVDGICRELGVAPSYAAEAHPTFVDGRCAGMQALGPGGLHVRGRLGEVHPEVLGNFSLQYPVALAELTLCPVV